MYIDIEKEFLFRCKSIHSFVYELEKNPEIFKGFKNFLIKEVPWLIAAREGIEKDILRATTAEEIIQIIEDMDRDLSELGDDDLEIIANILKHSEGDYAIDILGEDVDSDIDINQVIAVVKECPEDTKKIYTGGKKCM